MHNSYILFPNFNPIIISIFNVSIRWYGVMYLLGFVFILNKGTKSIKKIGLKKTEIEDILYFSFFGLIIGGRLGYILFYNPLFYFNNFIHIFKVWEGGMSFHGGLLGVIIVILYFSRKFNRNFFLISDSIVPLVPIALGAGRIGNFINGELWGRVAPGFSFSILFPMSREMDLELAKNDLQLQLLIKKFGMLPRHPSQIYEFFLEGIILFFVLYYYSKKVKTTGVISSIFLIFYGIFRIIVEIFREPDYQIGLFKNVLTMGQILSIPMIILGILIIFSIRRKSKTLI
ncbi:MAG: prolipoprotein diacylglyceryl transferase [Buchnera aphidicola (Kaburagia rhusicola ensigallis)]